MTWHTDLTQVRLPPARDARTEHKVADLRITLFVQETFNEFYTPKEGVAAATD